MGVDSMGAKALTLPGVIVKRLWPMPLATAFAPAAAGTIDLMVFSALLVLTAAFGRPFSKLGVSGAHVFVTEIALIVTLVLAARRCGIRGVAHRIRDRLPLVPLLVFWLAGAVALARGLHSYGVSATTHDVGLVEYSIVLPIVAIAADTRAKLTILVNVLLASGIVSALVFVVVYFASPHGPLGLDVNPSSAIGLYIAGFLLLFAARGIHGVRWTRLEIAAGAFAIGALLLLMLLVTRSVLLALVAAVVVLAALAPRRRTLIASAAVIAIGVSVAAAVGLERLHIGAVTTVAAAAPVYVRASPNFIADDELAAFNGGTLVRGDAHAGRFSREIVLHGTPYFELPALHGLHRGKSYELSFWLKPLEPARTFGRVGDTSGYHWGQRSWVVAGRERWQHIKTTLVATKRAERIVVYVDSGAQRVLIDELRVTRPGTSVATARPTPITHARPPQSQPALVATIGDSFSNSESGTGAYANQSWRLAFWRYMLRQTVKSPVFGVGFGKPANFRWHGTLYDARRDDPSDPNNVTGPHNSFVNLFYRTGVVGAGAFVALVAVALWRVRRGLMLRPSYAERSRIVGLTALFVFAVVIASLNVALEGPFMSLFFWTILGLLFAAPSLAGETAARTAKD